MKSRYHAISAVTRFQTFDGTFLPGLKDLLQRRGYRHGEPTVTMFRHPRLGSSATAEVKLHKLASEEWLAVYLGAITENHRVVNAEIIRHIRAPHAFFGYRDGCGDRLHRAVRHRPRLRRDRMRRHKRQRPPPRRCHRGSERADALGRAARRGLDRLAGRPRQYRRRDAVSEPGIRCGRHQHVLGPAVAACSRDGARKGCRIRGR